MTLASGDGEVFQAIGAVARVGKLVTHGAVLLGVIIVLLSVSAGTSGKDEVTFGN